MQSVLDVLSCVHETLRAPRSGPSSINILYVVRVIIVIISINKPNDNNAKFLF